MEDQQTSRRNFLQQLGLTTGAAIIGTGSLSAFPDKAAILKLNPEQQEFMLRYGSWMDEMTDALKVQKADPDNMEHRKKIMQLSDKAEQFIPVLNEYMKDEQFALIYHASIDQLKNEI